MEYEYDSWNRIQNMTYPDGEVVSYRYNKGGMLQSIIGEKNGISYPYIGNILYDEFELKKKKEYGNSTHTEYEYDDLQRLVHLESRTLQGEWMQDIVYDYDGVGNITKITNVAGALANGLGGTYNNEYTYDNLYRLTYSVGSWSGHTNLSYEEETRYYPNGRIYNKVLEADVSTQTPGVNSTSHISYDNYYHYENTGQPNTLTSIESSDSHELEWDATGNMVYHQNNREGYSRHLCWDEVNRLQGVVDDTHQSFYQYDAYGERTYKLTTSERAQLINGHWNYYTVMDNATLYASPYLVVTRQGYTKHYYAENERIASKIGMGGLTDICQCLCPDMTLQSGNQGGDPMNQLPYELADLTDCEGPEECFYDKLALNHDHFERVMRECLESNPNVEPNTLNEALYSFRENMEEYEPDCYWYHPDHLGSSSWISYTDGEAVQHLHYLPWGEDFVDQRTTNWNARHTFSAKEKDSETGLSYFGSRYYSSDLSIWLSVDPMSDKYPSLSPYTYCANNPIKLVDPNGEEIGKYYDLNGNYIGHDGIDDDKIYVVTGQPTGIPSSDPRDQYNKKDIFQVPSFGRRKEIVDKLEEFDKQSPNAEWGGVCGVGIIPNTTMYGIERNVWGEPSQDGDPTGSSRLEYRQLNAKDIGDKGINGFSVFFDYHSHGSGGWIQEPSKWLDSQTNIWKGDIPNVTQRLQVSSGPRTFAVFAMKEKNVYFYTNEGICGKMDFNTFRNLGQ